jgi:hypothetical protein
MVKGLEFIEFFVLKAIDYMEGDWDVLERIVFCVATEVFHVVKQSFFVREMKMFV